MFNKMTSTCWAEEHSGESWTEPLSVTPVSAAVLVAGIRSSDDPTGTVVRADASVESGTLPWVTQSVVRLGANAESGIAPRFTGNSPVDRKPFCAIFTVADFDQTAENSLKNSAVWIPAPPDSFVIFQPSSFQLCFTLLNSDLSAGCSQCVQWAGKAKG